MVLLFLLAATAGQPSQPARLEVARQATATVRIVKGERISASRLPGEAIVRETKVRGADGTESAYRLVEFP